MKKIQKTVDVWVASDGSEFFTPGQCEAHELKLEDEKSLTLTQLMCAATDKLHRKIAICDRRFWKTHPSAALNRELQWGPEARATRHTNFMQRGIELGWWEGVNERGDPIPHPIIIKISELGAHENTMAHILAKIGVFSSIGDARRNGWNRPIITGEFWFQKKTKRLQIVE